MNEIIHGDCVEVMRERIADDSIDLVVTSPPYDDLRDYDGYKFDARLVGCEMLRSLKQGGVAVWVVGDSRKGGVSLTSFDQALMFRDMGFTVHDVMIYRKLNTPFMRKNAYTPCYEFMFVLSKGAPKTFNPLLQDTIRSGRETAVYGKGADGDNSKRRQVTLGETATRPNVWNYAVGYGGTTKDRDAFEHPAMFPEQLAADHIRSWSNAGDVVLDPMCGSGTTCKAAMLLDRRYIGIDTSERYCEIARERLANAGGLFA